MNPKSGNTPLLKVEDICEYFHLPNIFIKDESKNPFGTWKDRRSEVIIAKAKKEGVNKICLITAGNAGYSLAKFAEGTGIKIVCIVDKNIAPLIKEVLQNNCYKIIEVDHRNWIEKEEIMSLAKENDQEVIWNATNGFPEAYESIVQEIKTEAPDYIICPIATGEAFIGLNSGLKVLGLTTKLIGVMPEENPSFADKLSNQITPDIQSLLKDGNEIIKLREEEIKSTYEYAKNYVDCEPSSAIVFGVFSKIKFNKNNKIILINSGKGLL